MTATSADQIEVSPSPNSLSERYTSFRTHGDGAPNDSCGFLQTYAHKTGTGSWHAETGVRRCHRWECPKCWQEEHGALGREVARIHKGIGTDDLTEIVLVPSCEPGMLREAWYRRELIQGLRKAAGGAIIPPGAWVLHERTTLHGTGHGCPFDAEHLHVFTRRLHGTLPVTIPGTGCQIEVQRKPGLREALRIGVRVALSPGTQYGRRKWVAWIGWFGRRGALPVPKGEDGKPLPKPPKTRKCHLCEQEVPLGQWAWVFSTVQKLPEGWVELTEAETRRVRAT